MNNFIIIIITIKFVSHGMNAVLDPAKIKTVSTGNILPWFSTVKSDYLTNTLANDAQWSITVPGG